MPCIFKPDMHHTCLCIMPCLCDGCLLCCLFLSGLLLSLASVSFRSCEDSFDYVRLSSSWTRSSSLRDLRQDEHTLESLLSLIASCSLYRYVALPTTCYIMPPILPCQASNSPGPAKRCLAKLPVLHSPSYSDGSCR